MTYNFSCIKKLIRFLNAGRGLNDLSLRNFLFFLMQFLNAALRILDLTSSYNFNFFKLCSGGRSSNALTCG